MQYYPIVMTNPDHSKQFFYRGAREIGLLGVQPLCDYEEFKEELKARGKKFVALTGRHYLDYEGHEIAPDSDGATPLSFKLGPIQPPLVPAMPVPMGPMGQVGTLVNFKVF